MRSSDSFSFAASGPLIELEQPKHLLERQHRRAAAIQDALLVYSKGQYCSKYCLTSSLMTWVMRESALSASLNMIEKLEEVIHKLYGCAVIQREFDRLEKWADRYSKGKNNVLHLCRNSTMHQYRL